MKGRWTALTAVGAVLLLTAVAFAQEIGFTRIEAKNGLVGANLIDPPAHQPHDRVALFFSGDGARKIYEAMPSPAINAGRCEDGLQIKRSGGLTCTRQGRTYACDVGILLKSGQTRTVSVC